MCVVCDCVFETLPPFFPPANHQRAEMDPIVAFCKARQSLSEANKRMLTEATECREARKVLSDMLAESMVRHNVECMPVPGRDDLFVRMLSPSKPPPPVKTVEEGEDLLKGVGIALRNREEGKTLEAVLKHVSDSFRSRIDSSTPPKPRVSLVDRPLKKNLTTRPAAEVVTLAKDFASNSETRKQLAEAIRPFKVEKKAAEEKVVNVLNEPVTVHMRREGENAASTNMLRISRCERKPSSRVRGIGVREFLSLCRDSVSAVEECEDTDEFERELKREVVRNVEVRLLAQREKRPGKPYIKVLGVRR